MSGQSRGLVGDYDSGKGHGILYIVNLAKIMAWLWYEVGQEDGHEFGCDHGQDSTRVFSWSLIMSIVIAIDVSRLSGRIPFAANRFFLVPRFAKKTKAEKQTKN